MFTLKNKKYENYIIDFSSNKNIISVRKNYNYYEK